ncbi:MAG: hypothetical protein ABIV48_11140 [Pyrinomonadaceae bacterium]
MPEERASFISKTYAHLAGAVHSAETAGGHLLVCTESLPEMIRETK